MHTALLTLAIAALLPFALVAGVLLLLVLAALVLALFPALAGADGTDEVSDALADAGEVAVERGWWLGRAY